MQLSHQCLALNPQFLHNQTLSTCQKQTANVHSTCESSTMHSSEIQASPPWSCTCSESRMRLPDAVRRARIVSADRLFGRTCRKLNPTFARLRPVRLPIDFVHLKLLSKRDWATFLFRTPSLPPLHPLYNSTSGVIIPEIWWGMRCDHNRDDHVCQPLLFTESLAGFGDDITTLTSTQRATPSHPVRAVAAAAVCDFTRDCASAATTVQLPSSNHRT